MAVSFLLKVTDNELYTQILYFFILIISYHNYNKPPTAGESVVLNIIRLSLLLKPTLELQHSRNKLNIRCIQIAVGRRKYLNRSSNTTLGPVPTRTASTII